jgi:hypothetical protein
MKFLIPLLFLLVVLFSCKKDESDVSTVVINELMAVNSYSAMDQDNQFDDWIELYNNSSSKVDLSGCYLSDSKSKLTRWQFPAGTTIDGGALLIVWADADTLQAGLHTNFKLSFSGEKVYLVSRDGTVWDKVEYDEHTTEASYARRPNGYGEFSWGLPSHNKKN